MHRYEDNTSPQPNSTSIDYGTYITPKTVTYAPQNTFPTPPSDDENQYFCYQQQQQPDSSSVMLSPCLSSEIESSKNRFKRRSRTTFSKHQIEILESAFQKTQYPDLAVVDRLSQVLHLATERISIWFQNRRARHKKERKLQQAENKKQIELQSQNQPKLAKSSTTTTTTTHQPWNFYSPLTAHTYNQTQTTPLAFQNITNVTNASTTDHQAYPLANHFYSNVSGDPNSFYYPQSYISNCYQYSNYSNS